MKERLMKGLKALLPDYAFWPIAACLCLNVFVYYFPRLLHGPGTRYYDFSLPLDHQLPLVPAFILVYFGTYVFWYLGFALIAREDPKRCEVLFGEMIAKLICGLCFFIIPTTLVRPEITGNDLFSRLTRLMYTVDRPDNLFPSIHCLENWICWRGMLGFTRPGKGWKLFYFVLMLLVFASTLLLRQHVLLDIPAAMLAGEIGLFAAKKLRLGERYARWAEGRGLLSC